MVDPSMIDLSFTKTGGISDNVEPFLGEMLREKNCCSSDALLHFEHFCEAGANLIFFDNCLTFRFLNRLLPEVVWSLGM